MRDTSVPLNDDAGKLSDGGGDTDNEKKKCETTGRYFSLSLSLSGSFVSDSFFLIQQCSSCFL